MLYKYDRLLGGMHVWLCMRECVCVCVCWRAHVRGGGVCW